jgi:CubicO group peptidase (beta-lactamase class C family)
MVLPLLLTLAATPRAAVPPAMLPATPVLAAPAPALEKPMLPAHSFRAAASLDGGGHAAMHELSTPASASLALGALTQAEAAVAAEVERGGFAGASLAVGRYDQVVVERGFGRLRWSADVPEVDPDETVYDLASLTKVVATTTAVMLLVEDGKLELDAPVQRYLPEFSGAGKERVTIRHLLTHTSGLPAGVDLTGTPEEALARVLRVGLRRPPGADVEYSDVGFVVLYAAAEQAAGEPLWRLLDRRVYGPLGMRSTTFLPGEGCERCAPTFRRADGSAAAGRVHDPIANRLGGIAGNAGLFSTAHDLARFAAMLANGGELDGVKVLRASTVHDFAQRQPGAGTRALGWDTPSGAGSGAAGGKISEMAFGHTGFTGTSLWIDPERGTWAVLLSNRVFEPRANTNRIQAVRRSVHDWVAVAGDTGSSPYADASGGAQ